MIKIKIKDLTVTQYEDWLNQNCYKNPTCSRCIMEKRPITTTCSPVTSNCWFYYKKLCSEEFLNTNISMIIKRKISIKEKLNIK